MKSQVSRTRLDATFPGSTRASTRSMPASRSAHRDSRRTALVARLEPRALGTIQYPMPAEPLAYRRSRTIRPRARPSLLSVIASDNPSPWTRRFLCRAMNARPFSAVNAAGTVVASGIAGSLDPSSTHPRSSSRQGRNTIRSSANAGSGYRRDLTSCTGSIIARGTCVCR